MMRLLGALFTLAVMFGGLAVSCTSPSSPAVQPIKLGNTGQPFGPIPSNSDLVGLWQDAAVANVTGTGSSSFNPGLVASVRPSQVAWQYDGGNVVLSFLGKTLATSASTWYNCGTYTPTSAGASGTAGLVTCQVICQDVTATIDGGQTNGHASSGTITYQYNQAGSDAGGLTVNTGVFVPSFTNTISISAQGVLDGGTVYNQVETTTGSIYAQCVCTCNVLQVLP